MVPGEMEGAPIGTRLQNVLSVFGELSRMYLQEYETGDPLRRYETISLERLDLKPLCIEARQILDELLKQGLFIEEGTNYSRAQVGLSRRYDMNKIFSPAFETTYRVRNHLYLSKDRFEQYLLKPDEFLRHHRRKLTDLTEKTRAKSPGRLFDD